MTNERKLIGLRLNKALYDRVVARARADSRKPANYVEHLLQKWLMAESRQSAPPIDTSAPRPVTNAPPAPTIQVCSKCFGSSHADATVCAECGAPLPVYEDASPDDEDHSDEYDEPPTIAH